MASKIKDKKCRYCNKDFTPTAPLQNTCSYAHYIKHQEEKAKEKRNLQKQKKSISVSVLTVKLDKIFSEYIRKRDSLKTTGTLEKCICVTCGEEKEYSQFDCGHFVTRSSRSTRWEEKNCNGQCKVCNNWGSGRQYEHGKAIDKMYGDGTADLLIRLGNEPEKITSDLLQEKIVEYTEKLNELLINT